MNLIAIILIVLIAALHFFIMWFEMFAWESRGPKVFSSLSADLFPKTTAMAANQGLYNGFLGAGLIWSLLLGNPSFSQSVALFFLCCVFIAGIFGALTVSKRILFVQSVPSALAMLALMVG
ncbi:DUF1304 domain-containing protein [Octadecabacter sp. 1_MG-2023]|uniref:DUF1304 domain-containing protein n=1 Tax=unclassified Octadecabacter TaxID=196158 RepID=UPI0020900870|nr:MULTISPECIES: DUF1304 domain-containing protein [unclassified Octadecabacter]MDO6734492.1 DUF1304 domain-containing protein [Octadecabacter sp. 1_MG-2023]